MTIHLLPPHISRLIAAGEVVSRPLDVVRELVDNALDAGATRIEVEVEGGGLALVRVRDNGAGIAADSVALAPVRHATSKLEPEASAVERVSTLGFRGEALWAAAQAGELHLVTRPAAQVGASEVHAAGEAVTVRRTSAPAGTTVTVRSLFARLPARLRTQAPPGVEVREITALVGRYVLHHPGLYWRLTVDGEPRLTHAPSDHRGAVASVYGPLSANRVLRVEAEGVRGVVSRPELTRARRDRMHFSVNGRPILAPPELEKAVIEGFAELLPSGVAPLCVLDLTVAPEDHNPNVHPAKQVVALADLPGVAARVRAAVTEALAAHPLARAAPALIAPPEPQAAPARGTFPALTLVGVYQELYLLAQGEGDLWIVDAHAAHERALYERLTRELTAAPPAELPEPELLHLTPEQVARLHERASELRAWGLTIEDFGAGLARLRTLPAALAALPVPRLHEQIIEAALGDSPDPRRDVLARLACAPALKAGMLDAGRGEGVLAALTVCEQPWSCPHGRPTVLRLSERDLAHAFGRRGVRDVARGRDEVRDIKR
ncbi:DNA mismatch repair endonuclease MutL [Deinococcus metallilatus]|uniref:DNA mismatch repair protein MutL n=1 Tax=Deinococcus metallilatus TaxID=1211322 RepID=A0AAJ5F9K6_9DEIO|nr:DNA mismatch repair endonuclease MutL [Deinococcus metallilatus]MBB5294895.1 DNA mismatch repair protein MutL [Deinococcus metallilatus]QBY09392.1 DNA mismatch repair endonuclease MutL [Deinococcus metallilatus]RXJ09398.1 DNA mismatch repair endonuclease MutL [Deinococcus metallilatus]TLK28920.1 DNA mismatch repair endonuclease MutL [Deinococcus metallilatus]GMA16824.1 DNA mismatch repair protein MutL [Deinococcus metallilatus]